MAYNGGAWLHLYCVKELEFKSPLFISYMRINWLSAEGVIWLRQAFGDDLPWSSRSQTCSLANSLSSGLLCSLKSTWTPHLGVTGGVNHILVGCIISLSGNALSHFICISWSWVFNSLRAAVCVKVDAFSVLKLQTLEILRPWTIPLCKLVIMGCKLIK